MFKTSWKNGRYTCSVTLDFAATQRLQSLLIDLGVKHTIKGIA